MTTKTTYTTKRPEGILDEFINMEGVKRVIVPFFGDGSFKFYLQNKYRVYMIANDKNTPLINFWRVCKDEASRRKLCERLLDIQPTMNRERYNIYRTRLRTTNNFLEQALLYFTLDRCSFRGSSGYSMLSSRLRFTRTSIERIMRMNLMHIEFHNKDFSDFLDELEYKSGDLIFVDPPLSHKK